MLDKEPKTRHLGLQRENRKTFDAKLNESATSNLMLYSFYQVKKCRIKSKCVCVCTLYSVQCTWETPFSNSIHSFSFLISRGNEYTFKRCGAFQYSKKVRAINSSGSSRLDFWAKWIYKQKKRSTKFGKYNQSETESNQTISKQHKKHQC